MSRKNRITERDRKRQEREESYNGVLKKNYAEMARKGFLGKQELKKYEEMRTEINRYYSRIHQQCPFGLPCEAKGEVPMRQHYNLANKLYNKLP